MNFLLCTGSGLLAVFKQRFDLKNWISDGELTSYDGENLTVDNVSVSDSQLSQERICQIVSELNAKYSAQNVIFVIEKRLSQNIPLFISVKYKPFIPTAILSY
jgi:hypothetical protein